MVDVDATPLIAGDELYAIAYNGQLMARKLMTGDEVWKRKYSGYRDMAVTGNAIVLTDSRSHLFAVDRRNGLELWSNTQLENRTVTAPSSWVTMWWSAMWKVTCIGWIVPTVPSRPCSSSTAVVCTPLLWWMVTPCMCRAVAASCTLSSVPDRPSI